MNQRLIYLHLGLPKTATTYLQRNLFPGVKGLRYLGRHDGLNDQEQFIIGFANYFHFYPQQALIHGVRDIEQLIQDEEESQYGEVDTNLPLFISDEGLTFRLFDAFDKQWYGRSAACAENFFKRLAWFSSESKYTIRPILVLRQQHTWLPSFFAEKYMHLRTLNETASYPSFLQYALGKGYYIHGFNNIDYLYLIRLLHRHFKESDTLVVPYEMLSQKEQRFMEEFARFTTTSLAEVTIGKKVHSSRVGKNEYAVRIEIQKDKRYGILKKLKRKLIGNFPVPKKYSSGLLVNLLYPVKDRTFTVTNTDTQRIIDFFTSSNEGFLQENELFKEYW